MLRANPLIAALQLFAWLFFRPSAWRAAVVTVDPSLSPHFCLADLNRAQLNSKLLWHILFIGYGLWPGLILAIYVPILWRIGLYPPGLMLGWGISISLGLLFGIMVGLAAGIGVTIAIGALTALLWGAHDVVLIDLLTSSQIAVIFGTTGGTLLHVTNNIAQPMPGPLRRASPLRRTGSFVIGLVGSSLVATLAALMLAVMVRYREAGAAGDWSIRTAVGVIPGAILGFTIFWRTRQWRRALLIGVLLFGLIFILFGDVGSTYGLDPGGILLVRTYLIPILLTYAMLFVLSYVLVEPIAGAWAGAVAGCAGGLALIAAVRQVTLFFQWRLNFLVGLLILLLSLTLPWWRSRLIYPLEMLWNRLLYALDRRRPDEDSRSLLGLTAVFWDELQPLPLYGLERHLLWLIMHAPAEGQRALAAIERGPQRWASQAAQIELDARSMAQCSTILHIATAHTQLAALELDSPVSALLRGFGAISRDADASLHQTSLYHQRLLLREVEQKLEHLLRDLAADADKYASRFHAIGQQWQRVVTAHAETLAQQVMTSQEIPNPYVVGVPLGRQQQIFVGRANICAKLEEIVHKPEAPPVLLYGQRRMGKTSLLNNLFRLLPTHIFPLLVDLQGPVSLAGNYVGLLYNVAKAFIASAEAANAELPELTRDELASAPFTIFENWFDQMTDLLAKQGYTTILLALDEFEALDRAFVEKRFEEEAVLGTLRHIVQNRPRCKLLLTGAHTLAEYGRRSNYFNNAQTVHLSYLQEEEARQLIERPMADFRLSYAAAATAHIIALTRGHPYLIQLLCAEIIAFKNAQTLAERPQVTLHDVHSVAPTVLRRGAQFFADIEQNQIDGDGLSILRFLASRGASDRCDLAALENEFAGKFQVGAALDNLLLREIIERVNDGYAFQIELIRRWFAQRVESQT